MTPLLSIISMPAGAEIIIIAVILSFIILWATAIVDIARSRFDTDSTKIVWMLVVIFTGIIGAIIYFLAGRQSRIMQ